VTIERVVAQSTEVVERSDSGVVHTLEQARAFLATAVEMTGPAEIAMVKMQVVMAETYARELHLSKEIRDDALEMIRRAEYALGKAIRRGQEEGTIRKQGEVRTAELSGQSNEHNGIYHLADNVEPEWFEVALSEAKAEGNLSRANVVRKVKGEKGSNRKILVTDLAAQGYTSRQIAEQVGIQPESVRLLARREGIAIPADKVVGGTRHINSTNVAAQTVTALEGLVMGVELINFDHLDLSQASQWADSLSHSLKVLNRFHKRIKETTQ
jgi:hypothetical protein